MRLCLRSVPPEKKQTMRVSPPYMAAVWFMLLCRLSATALEVEMPLPQDFLNGGQLPTEGRPPAAKKANAPGSTGALFWMWMPQDTLSTESGSKQVYIVRVAKNTPAHGVLQEGDVPQGIGGKPFEGDMQREMAAAQAAQAEGER